MLLCQTSCLSLKSEEDGIEMHPEVWIQAWKCNVLLYCKDQDCFAYIGAGACVFYDHFIPREWGKQTKTHAYLDKLCMLKDDLCYNAVVVHVFLYTVKYIIEYIKIRIPHCVCIIQLPIQMYYINVGEKHQYQLFQIADMQQNTQFRQYQDY